MKTATIKLNETALEIDFDFIEGQEGTNDTPRVLESVEIHQIRLAELGWEQDCIPTKDMTLIKEILLQRDYVEVAPKRVTEDLFKLFGDILNPTNHINKGGFDGFM
jgi:hypothetical protein